MSTSIRLLPYLTLLALAATAAWLVINSTVSAAPAPSAAGTPVAASQGSDEPKGGEDPVEPSIKTRPLTPAEWERVSPSKGGASGASDSTGPYTHADIPTIEAGVFIDWTDLHTEDTIDYILERRLSTSDDSYPWRKRTKQITGETLFYYDKDAAPGMVFDYRVRRITDDGEHPYVVEKVVTEPRKEAIGFGQFQRRIELRIMPSSDAPGGMLRITRYDSHDDATGTSFITPGGVWNAGFGLVSVPDHEDLGGMIVVDGADAIKQGKIYRYKIEYVRINDDSSVTVLDKTLEDVYAQAGITPDPRPKGLRQHYAVEPTVQIRWVLPDGVPRTEVAFFEIHRSIEATSATGTDIRIVAATAKMKHFDHEPAMGNVYYYRVRAVDWNGNRTTMSSPELEISLIDPKEQQTGTDSSSDDDC